jgi:hypothetical protein
MQPPFFFSATLSHDSLLLMSAGHSRMNFEGYRNRRFSGALIALGLTA